MKLSTGVCYLCASAQFNVVYSRPPRNHSADSVLIDVRVVDIRNDSSVVDRRS